MKIMTVHPKPPKINVRTEVADMLKHIRGAVGELFEKRKRKKGKRATSHTLSFDSRSLSFFSYIYRTHPSTMHSLTLLLNSMTMEGMQSQAIDSSREPIESRLFSRTNLTLLA
ncbi:hypothetical protein LOAG_09806 [Loa loa]|uniref:Uncharacterized protein n=1 Tax=Loa loa TaxID=7209 RepID=A0A1S0TQY6_LOALO|nr:hypothetical protein LOAG_09806 [Loa loa]EFO18687.1 hypothetical protein LOAG_09806 [Loa loa]